MAGLFRATGALSRAPRQAVALRRPAELLRRVSVQFGDDAEPAAVAAWRAQVVASGARPSRIPAGRPHGGELAAAKGSDQYNTRNVVYTLAPAAVRQADGHYAADLATDVALGAAADLATTVLSPFASVANDVLEAPRAVVSKTLGVPDWASSALLLGGLALAGYVVVRSVKR